MDTVAARRIGGFMRPPPRRGPPKAGTG
jgi:hypothetical protein